MHVVQGADYVHTWQSNGDGTFAVGTFRPWAGYATPNGEWRALDLDGDRRTDLVHLVAGSDYAHTWRSNGDGTFAVGTFSPWPGYAVPNGLWLAGDLTADGKADVLHAVAGASYVHPWLSTLPRPGEFALEGLEITQGIQNMPHDVTLVADKPTVVRAYLQLNGTGTQDVRGRLWVRNTAGAPWRLLESENAAMVVAAEAGNLQAKREDVARSLNFVVPPEVLGSGELVAWFQDIRDAAGTPLACSNCAITHRTLAVGADNPMRLRVLGLRYVAGTPAQTFEPGAVDFDLLRSWIRRAYPTGELQMTSATLAATAAAPFGCADANAQLTAIRNADVAAGTDRRTHYYGLVFENGAAGSFFMRGCAAGIPSAPSPETVASGPTGAGTWGWDADGSYGDWYGGHELGHTYGRLHLGSGCGDSSDDASYPFPSGQLSGADGAFVGFDTGDAGLGIAMRALPGTTWHDVMSYCANQWTSSYTYDHLRARLAAENALPAGATPAEALVAGATPPAVGAGRPTIVEGAPSRAGLGADADAVVMVAPAYAPPGLVEAAGSAPKESPAPAASGPAEVVIGGPTPLGAATGALAAGASEGAQAGPLPPHLAEQPSEAAGGPAAEPPALGPTTARTFQDGDFLAVVGSVNLTEGTARIVDARRVEQALVPVGDPGETLVLVALDAAGEEVGRWNVPFPPNSEREPGEDLEGVLDAAAPFPEGVRTIEVLVAGGVAASFTAPEAGAMPRAELQVEAAGTASGAEAAGVVLDWSSAGTVPEGTTFDVQASTDGGASWSTVAIGLTDTRTEVDLSGLSGAPVDLRLLVKEGFAQRVLDTVRLDEVP